MILWSDDITGDKFAAFGPLGPYFQDPVLIQVEKGNCAAADVTYDGSMEVRSDPTFEVLCQRGRSASDQTYDLKRLSL